MLQRTSVPLGGRRGGFCVINQSLQYLNQVRIRHFVLQQGTQIVQCGRYGIDEMLLSLKITAVAVCAEHLQGAEEDKQIETLHERMLLRHVCILRQNGIVFFYQILAQAVRIAC